MNVVLRAACLACCSELLVFTVNANDSLGFPQFSQGKFARGVGVKQAADLPGSGLTASMRVAMDSTGCLWWGIAGLLVDRCTLVVPSPDFNGWYVPVI